MLRKILISKRSCEKLDFKLLKVFKIKRQIKPVNFELQLFTNSKIYSIFHVLLLKSALDNASLVNIINYKEYKNQDYKVEKILAQDKIKEKNH